MYRRREEQVNKRRDKKVDRRREEQVGRSREVQVDRRDKKGDRLLSVKAAPLYTCTAAVPGVAIIRYVVSKICTPVSIFLSSARGSKYQVMLSVKAAPLYTCTAAVPEMASIMLC